MGFNPLKEQGIPIDKQTMTWEELNIKPYNKKDVHPHTRTRVILMNGIEVESTLFSHQMARHFEDMSLRRHLAQVRRIEQQQQKMINWLNPGDQSPLETTIGYEQVAVDLTAWLARTEPNPYVKQALDFALLEDFDHLYRYANLMDLLEGKHAESIVDQLTEVIPGRPTSREHRHSFDDVRNPTDDTTSDILTKLHILTIVAGEQQTMNYYMNVGASLPDFLGRGLYQEIAMIEEQHVTHYESLIDPNATWFEMMVLHEYNECYNYYSYWQQEVDPRIKKIWERNLFMEVEHLRIAVEMLKQYENRDASEFLPDEMPEPIKFQSNIDYVRDILKTQLEVTTEGPDYVLQSKLPETARYFRYQKLVNQNGNVPSEMVIKERINKSGEDYRVELRGPHPIEAFRSRKKVTV